MKDITKMLRKGNLTPTERVLLVIKNDAHRIISGKHLLSKADIEALTAWRPRNNHEVQEYNTYLDVWDKFQLLEIDMQTCP